jgi:hypothetical protein
MACADAQSEIAPFPLATENWQVRSFSCPSDERSRSAPKDVYCAFAVLLRVQRGIGLSAACALAWMLP